ncbi:MAG: hypothetical protein JWN04_4894 [Myxococcaceae bacterium]|nr:hypothetical protein [Myxococcaceae bacterium]
MREFNFLRTTLVCALLNSLACADSPTSDAPSLGEEPGQASGSGPSGDTPIDASRPSSPRADASSKPSGQADAAMSSDGKTQAPPADGGVYTQPDAGHADASMALPSAPLKPKCMKKDSQLIMIGDSYQNWPSHTFPQDMAKAASQTWRLEAVGGYSMGSGGLGLIPPEFDSSIMSDPDAHTVLLDGGGNDVLLPDLTLDPLHQCQATGSSKLPSCQKIITLALDAATKLVDRMASAGIRDVVYFFYPHVPANTVISGPAPNEILDYALPMVRAFCDGREAATGGKLRCTFVDMVPVFDGHPDWFNTDIHPNSTGSAAMAKKIWQVMTDKCIAQKSGADCCEP